MKMTEYHKALYAEAKALLDEAETILLDSRKRMENLQTKYWIADITAQKYF